MYHLIMVVYISSKFHQTLFISYLVTAPEVRNRRTYRKTDWQPDMVKSISLHLLRGYHTHASFVVWILLCRHLLVFFMFYVFVCYLFPCWRPDSSVGSLQLHTVSRLSLSHHPNLAGIQLKRTWIRNLSIQLYFRTIFYTNVIKNCEKACILVSICLFLCLHMSVCLF